MSAALLGALAYAGELQRAVTLGEIVAVAHRAVLTHTRLRHAWMSLIDATGTSARVIMHPGPLETLVLENCVVIPIAGDRMMEEIVRDGRPVVVVDARTDPRTNKEIVAKVGNRTIINVPLQLGHELLGSFGAGTYGDEPCLAPTEGELEFLTVLGMQLASAHARLEAIGRWRAEADARERLQRHLETLQRVELMGLLAAGVAHDLANYLSVISTSMQAVPEGRHDPQLLGDVRLAAEKSLQVTQQLLALGRAQAARREPVDLGARVASTLQLVRAALPRDVKVALDDRGAPPVQGDPVQLDQVLANLVINARDAVGPAGTIRIEVEERTLDAAFAAAHPWARPGRFAHVAVADDGCGIPAAELPRIFDPLFTTKRRGTGLGLAVVSRAVDAHQGLIHCESTPGAGTRFDLYLPA